MNWKERCLMHRSFCFFEKAGGYELQISNLTPYSPSLIFTAIVPLLSAMEFQLSWHRK
jgi:hypothetical protein